VPFCSSGVNQAAGGLLLVQCVFTYCLLPTAVSIKQHRVKLFWRKFRAAVLKRAKQGGKGQCSLALYEERKKKLTKGFGASVALGSWRLHRDRFFLGDPIVSLFFQFKRQLLIAGAHDTAIYQNMHKIRNDIIQQR